MVWPHCNVSWSLGCVLAWADSHRPVEGGSSGDGLSRCRDLKQHIQLRWCVGSFLVLCVLCVSSMHDDLVPSTHAFLFGRLQRCIPTMMDSREKRLFGCSTCGERRAAEECSGMWISVDHNNGAALLGHRLYSKPCTFRYDMRHIELEQQHERGVSWQSQLGWQPIRACDDWICDRDRFINVLVRRCDACLRACVWVHERAFDVRACGGAFECLLLFLAEAAGGGGGWSVGPLKGMAWAVMEVCLEGASAFGRAEPHMCVSWLRIDFVSPMRIFPQRLWHLRSQEVSTSRAQGRVGP